MIVLLVGVLAAAVVAFAVTGALQRRRTRALARKAHEMGMRFSPTDPFDVPRRYAQFALISAGHSPRANNVIYGGVKGLPLRMFDFRYEVGHGTRRMARHYSVVMVETDQAPPPMLMWNDLDAGNAPLDILWAELHLAGWTCLGDETLAETLADVCRPMAAEGVSVQVCRTTLMLCASGRKWLEDCGARAGDASGIVEAVRACTGATGDQRAGRTPPQKSPNRPVENSAASC